MDLLSHARLGSLAHVRDSADGAFAKALHGLGRKVGMDPARVGVSGRFQGLMFSMVARVVIGRGRYGCVLSIAVADGKPRTHFGHRRHHVKPLRVVEVGRASPLSKEFDCGDRERARDGWRLRKVPVSLGIRPTSPAAPDNSQHSVPILSLASSSRFLPSHFQLSEPNSMPPTLCSRVQTEAPDSPRPQLLRGHRRLRPSSAPSSPGGSRAPTAVSRLLPFFQLQLPAMCHPYTTRS